ncbi:MAG TPA: DUF2239 family protein [Candidatus Saccharimonadales bacterium]|nr:DUF2239 family protein [Candidatus Saccharimonadales bacterium]
MHQPYPQSCTAFAGSRRIASGDLAEVALKVKEVSESGDPAPILIFDDWTSEQVEVDVRGSAQDVLARLEKSRGKGSPNQVLGESGEETPHGPGRPKLGVIGREVTLLPRHWDWLNRQPGGASVTLRNLVEAAKRANAGKDRARLAREATYRFMVALGGNLPGFEEATRGLFAKRKGRFKEFEKRVHSWPGDIRRHVLRLMKETIKLEEMSSATIGHRPAKVGGS